jgi:cytochrome oxidase Cu insertion factor (SCO1/SenC/PrrC family)
VEDNSSNINKPQNQMWKLWLVALVCVAPIVASYFYYYVVKPGPSTNYGTLLDARQYPMPALGTATLDGRPESLDTYKGRWILLQVDRSDCDAYCRKKLYYMRQLRLAQGKDLIRIERVWLITDNQPLDTMLIREYDGTHMLRVNDAVLRSWLPVEQNGTLADHIYVIDPLGNLIMRYPKNFDADKINKDIGRLLKASSIG